MWAQLEAFMVKADLQSLSIGRQAEKRGNAFDISFEIFDETDNDAFPEGFSTSLNTSVEDCAIEMAQKLNRTADVSLQIVNAVKL